MLQLRPSQKRMPASRPVEHALGASKMRADEISIIFLALLDVAICFAIYESAIGGLSHLFAAA
jgi:hypothetical protein